MPPELRTVVFGAFDRHNLGDLLFAHIAAVLVPDRGALVADLFGNRIGERGLPGVVPLDHLAAGITQALSADPVQLAAHSARLAELCREGCAQ